MVIRQALAIDKDISVSDFSDVKQSVNDSRLACSGSPHYSYLLSGFNLAV